VRGNAIAAEPGADFNDARAAHAQLELRMKTGPIYSKRSNTLFDALSCGLLNLLWMCRSLCMAQLNRAAALVQELICDRDYVHAAITAEPLNADLGALDPLFNEERALRL
jgi:hypothetical protein